LGGEESEIGRLVCDSGYNEVVGIGWYGLVSARARVRRIAIERERERL